MKTEELAQMSPTERRRDRLRVARRFLIGGGVASVLGNLADTALTTAAPTSSTPWWLVALSVAVSIGVSVAVPLVFIFLVDYVIKLESVEVRNMLWHRAAIVLTGVLAAITFTVSFTKLWNLLAHIPGESHIWWLTIALAAVPDLLMTSATLFMHTLSEPPVKRAKTAVVPQEKKARRGALLANPEPAAVVPAVEATPTPVSTPTPPAPPLPTPPPVSQAPAPAPTGDHLSQAADIVASEPMNTPVEKVAEVLALLDAGTARAEIIAATGLNGRTVTKVTNARDGGSRYLELAR